MIRLIAGLLIALSVLGASSQDVTTKGQGAASSGAVSRSGERGVSTAAAVVNFSELEKEQKAQAKDKKSQRPHRRMTAPSGFFPSANEIVGQNLAREASSKAVAASPAVSSSFLGANDNGNFIPPDTMGAVGPNEIVVALNGEFRILNRTGNLLSSVTLDQFWSRLGPFRSNGTFDPKVYYDFRLSRWFTVCCADAESSASSILVGMSQTPDPRGFWNLYRIDADATDARWADYPSVGQNSKWWVVTANMFPNTAGGSYGGAYLWVFDKNALASGGAQLPFTRLAEPSGFTMCPAITYDDNEAGIYIGETASDQTMRISRITGAVGQESLNVGISTVTSSYNWNPQGGQIARQLGSAEAIDVGDPRVLSCLFRNGSLWMSHAIFFPAIGAANRSAAQWWQVSPSGQILQQGLLTDPSASFAYPTIAVNRKEQMLIGYTKFASTIFPSSFYSFRDSTDPKGTVQTEQLLKAGEGSYFKDFGTGENRWGDYSATMVDPLNDIDMWTLQEFAAAPVGNISQWAVWWGMVPLSTPPDGVLEVAVSPTAGTAIATGAATDFFVTVTDSTVQVTGAKVVARVPGRPDITFRNDGTGNDAVANDNVYSASITFNSVSDSPVVFVASAPGFSDGAATNAYNIIPPISNDNFANATKIPASGIFGPTVAQVPNNFATSEPNEPLHAGVSNARSIWWNYSTTTPSSVLVDTSGTGPRVVVAVYTGTSLTTLSQVAATNPPPGTVAMLKFDAQAGETYRIVVAGADADQAGLVRLRVQPNGNPDITPPVLTVTYPTSGLTTNSDSIVFTGNVVDPVPDPSGVNAVLIQFGSDQVIPATLNGTNWTANLTLDFGPNEFVITSVDFSDNTSAPQRVLVYRRIDSATNDLFGFPRNSLTNDFGVDVVSNTNATREFNEPLHGGNVGGKSVWWVYFARTNGVLLLSTEGSTFDTVMGLYTIDPGAPRLLSNLIPVAENDDAPGGDGFSEIATAVEAGRVYYIAVDGYGGASGDIHLQYSFGESAVFPVTVHTTPGGTVVPPGGLFPSSSAVTLRAVADTYKQFDAWVITVNGITDTNRSNPFTFLLSGPTDVTVTFKDQVFTDDFEDGFGLPYNIPTIGPLVPWTVATVNTNAPGEATHSTKAAVVQGLGNGQVAILSLTTNLLTGSGSFEFGINTETNYDIFQFQMIVDGAVYRTWRWSGYIPWTKLQFDIPVTSNPITLEWRYTKDPALTVDNELVAIDNLDIPLAPPQAPPPTEVQLSVSSTPSAITITATGQPNHDFTLYSSSDLVNWQPVAGAEKPSGPTGVATFTITPAAGAGPHFYIVRED